MLPKVLGLLRLGETKKYISTFAEWDDTKPELMEAGLVGHRGESPVDFS